ncbi:efflux RND transporter permease subunit [Escherichia coli]
MRNSTGQMVPFSAFASTEWSFGSPRLERYNGVSAMEIVGEAAPGGRVPVTPWQPSSRW